MSLARGTGKRKYPIPPGVWLKTALILALAVAATTAYDVHYRRGNPYIRAVEQRIANFKRDPGKPLVVAIGGSLTMLGTPRDWSGQPFDWLRLIIQGSTLNDFAAATNDIVALKPDLILIDLHQFIHKPYDLRLRRAFKHLLRAPLEAYRLIKPAPSQFEIDACGSGLDLDGALEHIKEQFSSPENDIASSPMLEAFMDKGIPVAIIRVPMLRDIESRVKEKQVWLRKARRDAATLGLEIHDPHWEDLDERYFCPDKTHMSRAGERIFSAWLAPRITAELSALR
ncbi:MAG: hypothetical protein WB783_03035 [Arenicellales bacterium]